MGPDWLNLTAPNPPFVMPDGTGGNFTTRTNGLDVYTETYLAVGKALKAVVPAAGFGPSNMASISGGANGGGTGEACSSCPYLEEFIDRVHAAGAPLDFLAASEYSKWDENGLAPVAPMQGTVAYLGNLAKRGGPPTVPPIEVHEWGWAGWGHWARAFGTMRWPMGAWGGAWALGSLLYQRQGGCSRVFHWGYQQDATLALGVRGRGGNASATCPPGTTWCSSVAVRSQEGCLATCRHDGYPLLTGHGWLLQALLEVSTPRGSPSQRRQLAELVLDVPQPAAAYNHTLGVVKGSGNGTSGNHQLSYLVLHFSPNVTERATRRFHLQVPAVDVQRLLRVRGGAGTEAGGAGGAGGGGGNVSCAGLKVTQNLLAKATCTHDAIEAALFAKGLTQPGERRAVDSVDNMATAEGLALVVRDAGAWMDHNRRSMQLVDPFGGTVTPDRAGDGCTLTFDLETPSLMLLRVE